MADAGTEAGKQLREITECSICMSTFTDPRILSCIHTFCFHCLKRTAETAQKSQGDKIPCPLCRKEFIIPTEGITGLQKNFFMESLLSFRTALQMGSVSISCDICSASDEGKTGKIPMATMKCVQCRDNYCDSCIKVHKFQKPNKHHQVLKIGDDTSSEIKQIISSVKFCTKHTQKPLDYYCAECKKIVCVSCFVESHQSHDCKDITTVDEGFSKTIGRKIWKMSTYVDEMVSIRKSAQKGQADFLKKLAATENAILQRNEDLKEMIDRHTKTLLDELAALKSDHVKQIEIRMEELDRLCTFLTSFKAYCTELMSRGSASDICSSIDQLILRGDELERDHKSFISRPQQTTEVFFEIADLTELYFLQKSNSMVGKLQGRSETTSQFDSHAVIIGLDDGTTVTTDVISVNLNRRNDISAKEQKIPTTEMTLPVVASVFCNTMYVTGTGVKTDEIWRYNENTGWVQCGSLVQGRRRHCAAFIEEVLYICGGYVDADESVIDSVEGYDVVTDECSTVGKLVHCVQSSGNCVAYNSSLYIFGGLDKDSNALDCVQVYDTKYNTCCLLSKPMPCSSSLMRAVLWETCVILFGRDSCFIFDLNTENWREREEFKTDVDYFGLILQNEELFVLGGGICETDKDGEDLWKCRDDVRYVHLQDIIDDKSVEWKIHATLPKSALIHAHEKLAFFLM